MNLLEIFNKHGTDKGAHHQYAEFYERYLLPIKNEPLKLLEIGIHNGSSLYAWYEYLPNAEIIGLDIDDKSHLNNDRIKTFKGHQGLRGWLKRFTDKFGKNFDFIIDDGSHFNKDMLVSLGYLYNHLKNGGVYFVEDLDGYLTLEIPPTVVGIFKKFEQTGEFEIEGLSDDTVSGTMTQDEIDFVKNNTEKCYFCDNDKLFIFERKND